MRTTVSYKKVSIILTVLIIVSLVGLFKFKLLAISNIEVWKNKADCIDKDKVGKTSNILGRNIFLVDFDKTSRDLKAKFACIEAAKFERRVPSTIVVKIEGRVPVARVIAVDKSHLSDLRTLEASPSSSAALLDWSFPDTLIDQLLFVDREGVVFTGSDNIHLPTVFVGNFLKEGQVLDKDLFEAVAEIFDKLSKLHIIKNDQTYDKNPKAKLVGNDFLIDTESLDDQIVSKLIFSLNKDIDKEVASLQLIFQKAKMDGRKIVSLDLRFDKPVVVYAPLKK